MLTLILRDHRFTFLRPPANTSTPPTWLKNTSHSHIIDLTGDGKPSSRVPSEATPSVHTIRTCKKSDCTPSVHTYKPTLKRAVGQPDGNPQVISPGAPSCQAEKSSGSRNPSRSSKAKDVAKTKPDTRKKLAKPRTSKKKIGDSTTSRKNSPYRTLKDQFTWTCNLCSCVVARGHHLRNFHAADRKFATQAFFEKADFFPVSDLPKEQRAWTCHNCQLGLPFLAGESFRKSRAAHVKACTGLTPNELMYVRLRTKESREICRQRQNALVTQRKQAALEAMEDLSACTGHQLVILPFATSGRGWSFTCAACTLTRPTLADIRKSGKKKPVLKLLPTKPDRDGGESVD